MTFVANISSLGTKFRTARFCIFRRPQRLSGSPKNIWTGLWNGISGLKKQKYTPKNTRDTPSRMRDREWRFLTAVKVSPDGLRSTCQAVRCGNLAVLAVIRFNRPRKTLPCRSRSNQREPVKIAAPAENLIRPVPVNGHDLANNPGRIRRHWR